MAMHRPRASLLILAIALPNQHPTASTNINSATTTPTSWHQTTVLSTLSNHKQLRTAAISATVTSAFCGIRQTIMSMPHDITDMIRSCEQELVRLDRRLHAPTTPQRHAEILDLQIVKQDQLTRLIGESIRLSQLCQARVSICEALTFDMSTDLSFRLYRQLSGPRLMLLLRLQCVSLQEILKAIVHSSNSVLMHSVTTCCRTRHHSFRHH